MKPACFIVRAGWQHELSGAATFLRSLFGAFDLEAIPYRRVEMPPEHFTPRDRGVVAKGNVRQDQKKDEAEKENSRPPSTLRLALGYLRTLGDEICFLRTREELRCGLMVVNEFGCETLPIAVRLVRPRAFSVAIAHTHPGRDWRGRHPVLRLVERLCHAAVSDVIYNSHSLKAEWAQKLGRSGVKGKVIWYGLPEPVDGEVFNYPPRAAGTVDFLCVARFVRWKGHKELLYAWNLARRKTSVPIRLVLVGDGPTLGEIRADAARMGLGDSVIFCGPHKNAGGMFRYADVGILLSIEPEAFGLVLLEAMSRGRPVIGSCLGGIPEVVEPGKSGLLVDPLSPTEVAEAICRLAESPELRHGLGQHGYRRWRQHFTVTRMVAEYRSYFENLP
ncbi:MAG: glycosyltransferase family 4 protein [Kiritimatiellia bacterium]